MDENKYTPVEAGQFVLSASGKDYEQIPAGEPLEFHVSKVETVNGLKFGSTTEYEDKLSIGFTLDEDIPGKGQVYTGWFRPSLNPKAKLTAVVSALYNGKYPDPLDINDIIGMPLRAIVTEPEQKNGKNRQYLDTYLKPKSSQKRVLVEEEFDGAALIESLD